MYVMYTMYTEGMAQRSGDHRVPLSYTLCDSVIPCTVALL